MTSHRRLFWLDLSLAIPLVQFEVGEIRISTNDLYDLRNLPQNALQSDLGLYIKLPLVSLLLITEDLKA